jgi:hypothetical protein
MHAPPDELAEVLLELPDELPLDEDDVEPVLDVDVEDVEPELVLDAEPDDDELADELLEAELVEAWCEVGLDPVPDPPPAPPTPGSRELPVAHAPATTAGTDAISKGIQLFMNQEVS